MSHHLFRTTILFAVVALFVVACGATPPAAVNAPVAPQATAPAQAPAAGPTTAQLPAIAPAATSPTQAPTQNSASASVLPQSLKEAAPVTVYTFQVDPAQTTVGYAVNEVLFGNKQITRGQTSTVDGQFQLGVKDGQPYISMSKLQVDLRTLKSDNRMRDMAIQRQWLESSKYPMAVFVAKSVEGLPADAVQGQPYTFKVSGDMTIRDITKPVTFDVTVTVKGTTITGEATTQIYMKDYGFNPPEILGRFTVTDPATITIKGVANLVQG